MNTGILFKIVILGTFCLDRVIGVVDDASVFVNENGKLGDLTTDVTSTDNIIDQQQFQTGETTTTTPGDIAHPDDVTTSTPRSTHNPVTSTESSSVSPNDFVSSSTSTSSPVSSTYSSTFTTPTSTSTSSSALSSSSTFDWSAETEDEHCSVDALLNNFCVLPADLSSVSFWDLYFLVFSESLLDALIMDCNPGDWCLHDSFDYWQGMVMERVDMVMNSAVSTDVCAPAVAGCVESMPDRYLNCSSYKQMEFTAEVIRLICDLKRNVDLTTICYRRTLEMLHVTFADLMRDPLDDDAEEGSVDTCNTPKVHMSKGLICITNSCPYEEETFKKFQPWAWFISELDEMIVTCEIDTKRCEALSQRYPSLLQNIDIKIMIGVSVVTMATLLMIMLVGCFGWRRYRRHAVLKEGYQQLLTEGDES